MDYPKVDQKNDWKIKLFPHQLTSIYMLEQREQNQNRCITSNIMNIDSNIYIYADPTGYGKTLSVIGWLSRDRMLWDMNTDYEHKTTTNLCGNEKSVRFSVHITSNFKRVNSSLLVVNQSIISQWTTELDLLNVKYEIVNSRKKADDIDVSKHKLIIVIPTMYNRLLYKTRNVVWKRFIFDEPVNTHIPSMTNINANFYLLITATPKQLLYQSGSRGNHFLRSIFNYWMPTEYFNTIILKNDIEYVKRSYSFPETNHLYHVCYQPLYNMCRGYLNRETSDMISAGNILGAIRRLGGNETSNIFELIESKLKSSLEQKLLQLRYAIISNNNTSIEAHNTKRLSLLEKIRDIKKQYTERLNDNCSICLDKLDKPVLVPCCQNIMCGGCILEWVKNHHNCPLCRTNIDNKSLVYIKSENEVEPKECSRVKNREMTKPETIMKIINNNKSGKFIVFSNYSETFTHIYNVLQTNHISYKELKGQTSSRKNTIEQFKKGVIKVLFLNSKNNGAGINLQEATDIILYHELTDELKTQVIGRANRIGRTESLFVHHLL